MLLTPESANKLQSVNSFLVVEYSPKKQNMIWGFPPNPIFHNFIIYSMYWIFYLQIKGWATGVGYPRSQS